MVILFVKYVLLYKKHKKTMYKNSGKDSGVGAILYSYDGRTARA